VRDPGWRFMDAGRRIERALQLAALLRATVTVERSTATDSLLVESVLIAAESIITYRRRYRSHAQLETLLDLLVFDADNPRSLAYQLDQLAVDVRLMPKLARGPRLSEPQRLALETSTVLGLADSAHLARPQGDGIRSELDDFLANILELVSRTADAIDNDHFVHPLPQHSMVSS
ncbi:MAG TPA: alpha-E domain-containing protein, partial [Acidimicrobiia bacterium]|nr:alpha-E domain-containing protein [Acidimicrobiia bacterium]